MTVVTAATHYTQREALKKGARNEVRDHRVIVSSNRLTPTVPRD
jgi:hypothetical protein